MLILHCHSFHVGSQANPRRGRRVHTTIVDPEELDDQGYTEEENLSESEVDVAGTVK